MRKKNYTSRITFYASRNSNHQFQQEEQTMAVKEISATLEAKGIKVGIAISRFNDFLTKQLRDGAIDCLVRHGGAEGNITLAWVPGANEIPIALEKLAATGKHDVLIALGAPEQMAALRDLLGAAPGAAQEDA